MTDITVPAIDRLCERWGSKTPENAIVKAVYASLPNLQTQKAPIDLAEVGFRRNIVSVLEAPMTSDGTISLTDSGEYAVTLNKKHSLPRRRFTYAHEIGHTFFFELDPEINLRARTLEDGNLEKLKSSSYEEHLCNLAAAEIIMPGRAFSVAARSMPPSAATVIRLAEIFKASLWAVSRRFVQTVSIRLLVGLWECDSQSYRTVWTTASSARKTREQFFVDRNAQIFNFTRSQKTFRGRGSLSLGGPVDDYYLDAVLLNSPTGPRILTVFILEPAAESLLGSGRSPVRPDRQLFFADS